MTGHPTDHDHAPADQPAKPKRRRFSDEYKLRILEEADRCTKPGELGLLLRREGLYSSSLAAWRRWRRDQLPEHPESKKPASESQLRHEIQRLKRDKARLQRGERSRPIVTQLTGWIDEQLADPAVLPKSLIGRALAYVRSHQVQLEWPDPLSRVQAL